MAKTAPRKAKPKPQPIMKIPDPPPDVLDVGDPPTGRFNPRRVTWPGPLFPLVVLFGLNAVDELDRVAFTVLIPEIRDWFGLSLTAVLIITTILAPISLLLEMPIAYY